MHTCVQSCVLYMPMVARNIRIVRADPTPTDNNAGREVHRQCTYVSKVTQMDTNMVPLHKRYKHGLLLESTRKCSVVGEYTKMLGRRSL